MSAYDTPTNNCPYCGTECEADWVDVGVGVIQCGPYYCENCGASEIGYGTDNLGFDYYLFTKWLNENHKFVECKNEKSKYIFTGEGEDKFILPETATITQEEWDKGWYKPNSLMGSSVNTYNGRYVRHEEAKKLYKLGLLDKKEE